MIERLTRDARLGDLDAARELARRLTRQGDLDAVRRMAWGLIEGGAEPIVTIEGQIRPLIHRTDADHLDARVCEPRVLVEPVRVGLLWDDRRARLFACDCAERVLPLYEREHPGDDRPRSAIKCARRFATGEARAAARAAAWAAARAAAWAAAWAAASAAARAAASAAAWAAASAAARDAEIDWQRRRVLAYQLGMGGVVRLIEGEPSPGGRP
jgi:hypothetical protein